MLLIRGEPGAGKTALVDEVQRPLAGLGGYFVAGKFELHRHDVPFLALRQALEMLAELLLVEDDEHLERWRSRILDEVGSLGRVLLELAPKLKGILGPQPPSVELGPLESRDRLLVAVSRLLAAVASTDHPLVIFFDDLQWSDSASLRLLEHLLVEVRPPSLLLIGACRDVDETHPLAVFLEQLEAKDRAPASIELGPLSPDDVTRLLAHALRTDRERARGLAASLAGRTHNNPLLIGQLLAFLADEGLLERGSQSWSWDDEAIRRAGIPEDVVGAVQAKVARLPRQLRDVLVAASCVGSRVDLPSLAAALCVKSIELLPHLEALCDEGLLTRSRDGYRFSHDRIEEAAAQELEPERQRTYHGRVGRFRRRNTAETDLADRVFEIADHLNWTVASESDPAVLLDLARIDHLAGVKAIRSAAYVAAERYFAAGIEALERAYGERQVSEQSRLNLSLRLDHARSLSLAGRHDEAARLFDGLLADPRDALDAGRICVARAEASNLAGAHEDAVRWGFDGLARCGLRLRRSPSSLALAALVVRLLWAFRGNAHQRVLALPRCTDPRATLRLELFYQMARSAYFVEGNRRLFGAVVISMGLEIMRHGRTSAIGMALIGVAVTLSRVIGRRSEAKRLAQAALDLSRGAGANDSCRTAVAATFSVLHWVRPLRDCLAEVEPAFEAGREEGDLEYAGLALAACATLRATLGSPLDQVKNSAVRAVRFFTDGGMNQHADRQQCIVRVCEVLSGQRELDPDRPDLPAALRDETPLTRCKEAAWQMQLLMILNRPRRAFDLAEAVAGEADQALFPIPNLPEFIFFHGLAAAACQQDAVSRKGRKVLSRAHGRLRRWARDGESSFGHKALLLEAESARLRGRHAHALDLYERAAASAGEHDIHHLRALALERLGRFARARQWPAAGTAALAAARNLYADWGAKLKIRQMEDEFPELRESRSVALLREETGQAEETATSSSFGSTDLDLTTVLKTSQAIFEEIRLDAVVEQVMAAAIENAGAQRGILLLEREGDLGLAAEGAVDEATVRHDPELPLEPCASRLALSVARLAARTGEPVVVDDAARDERFAADPYVESGDARSIACFPILKRGRRRGVLYLENNLAPGAFTAERADVLRVLTAQAAISLENARLYEDLRSARDRLAEKIEEQLRVDAMRQKLLAELEASNAELERFTYTASHDLKTPLVTIRGFLGVLREDVLKARTDRLEADMRIIEEATEKMYRMLDELLELSRIGRVTHTPQAVKMEDLVAEALRLAAAKIRARGVEVVVAPRLPGIVVDRRRFLEVLQNLVENAVDFMGGEPAPRIEITADEEPERTLITVADNGIGIDPAYHERVFGLFERLDASSPGTGVGLALVKRIVETHGGRIWVESEGPCSEKECRGSRFRVELPRAVRLEG